jgi:hypothetical protein
MAQVQPAKYVEYRSILPAELFDHLKNCFGALQSKQYFAAAVWGAVFLEAFLGEVSRNLALPHSSQDDLSGRIQQLRQYSKNHAPGKPDVPDDVVKRCDDIRNTRNRLVHDTGLPKSTLRQDAEFIAAGLEVILEWYAGLVQPQAPQAAADAVDDASLIPVFLSTITPHTVDQALFLDAFLERMRTVGVRPVRAEYTTYDRRDPVGKIRQVIEGCRGVITVGLERSHSYFLREKEGSDGEREAVHRKFSSGWLHLEAGVASALGKPVFVVCEHDLCSDGVFDREWNSFIVTEISSLDPDSPELSGFFRHIEDWAKGVAPA